MVNFVAHLRQHRLSSFTMSSDWGSIRACSLMLEAISSHGGAGHMLLIRARKDRMGVTVEERQI